MKSGTMVETVSTKAMERLAANKETARTRLAESRKRREAIEVTDAALDRATGRMIRWANVVAKLRNKKARQVRELAKYIAANS